MAQKRLVLLFLIFLLSACAGEVLPTVTPFPTPGWPTPTLPPTPTAPPQPSPTPIPSPTTPPTATPNPVTHAVIRGEDMFGIALRYGISLEALRTANPAIDPYSMAEGSLLSIPLTPTPLPESEPTPNATPNLTQVPLPVACYRDAAQTVTCLVPYTNRAAEPVENPSAVVVLQDVETGYTKAQEAILPLNLLLPGQKLPLVTRFYGPTPANFTAQANFADQLPVMPDDSRYLNLPAAGFSQEIETEGRWADLEINLPAESAQASSMRVLAVTWSAADQPLGWRIVDLQSPIEPAKPLAMQVFSLGDKIARVSVHLEARP